jgi:hypothetical protein
VDADGNVMLDAFAQIGEGIFGTERISSAQLTTFLKASIAIGYNHPEIKALTKTVCLPFLVSFFLIIWKRN